MMFSPWKWSTASGTSFWFVFLFSPPLDLPSYLQQDGETSQLYYIAKALMRFQQMFGHIPNIKGRGKHAGTVADMLLKFTKEVMLSVFIQKIKERQST